MKTLLFVLLLSTAAFADYPDVPEQVRIDVETLVRLASEGRILAAKLSEQIPRLRDADVTLPKVFADLAPEFGWNSRENRASYTITVSNGDCFNRRSDVTHSAVITTDKHTICIRLRESNDKFHLVGYAVEQRTK